MAAPEALRQPPGHVRHLPWWMRPSALNLLFVLPVLLAVFWGAQTDFIASESRTRNYLTGGYMALCVGLVLVSVAGAWMGEHVQEHLLPQSPIHPLVHAATAVGVVVLVSYLFWFRSLFLSPSELFAILAGGDKPDRSQIGRLVGVTSLVNLGALFFSLAGYLLFVRRSRDGTLIGLVVVLLLLTLFRSYVWSERLAVAEAMIPLALAFLSRPSAARQAGVRHWVYQLGPYAALPVVFLFFAVAEYFRSWPYYQDRMAFWDFALGRFVSYYYTSINNGAGMLATLQEWPTARLEHVLLWLHSFPLGIGSWFSSIMGLDEFNATGAVFLQRYADPEFNTTSSFAAVTSDLGVAGAILYFFLSMFCGGVLYARYARGDLLAVMLYPSVLVALFESFRYCYWGTSRAFVWFLGAIVVMAVLWACGAIGAARPTSHGAR